MEQGVIVATVITEEPAAQLGILPGDILESINKTKIKTKEQTVAILEQSAASWILKLRRGDQVLDFQVTTK